MGTLRFDLNAVADTLPKAAKKEALAAKNEFLAAVESLDLQLRKKNGVRVGLVGAAAAQGCVQGGPVCMCKGQLVRALLSAACLRADTHSPPMTPPPTRSNRTRPPLPWLTPGPSWTL